MSYFFLLPPGVVDREKGLKRVGSEVHWVNQYGGKICELDLSEAEREDMSHVFVQLFPDQSDVENLDEIIHSSYFYLPGR